jgi:hypothetical protein
MRAESQRLSQTDTQKIAQSCIMKNCAHLHSTTNQP